MFGSRAGMSRLAQESASFDPAIGWGLGVAVVVTAIGVCTLRVVPAGQVLVLLRSGTVVGVKGAGLAAVLPGIHQVVRVRLGPRRIDIMWLEAAVRDGVTVSSTGSLLFAVVSPDSYARTSGYSDEAVRAVAEQEFREYIGTRVLADLVQPAEEDLRDLAGRIDDRTREWGIAVCEVELADVEIRLSGEVIRWAEKLARRSEGASAMDITRSTVPGTGILHHCVTRTGQQLGVLVENSTRRQLLVYGSPALDVPSQTIVLEPDEADQIAAMLSETSIADRLAALERRVHELSHEAL